MSRLRRASRNTSHQGNLVPATVVDVVGDYASVRVSGVGVRYTGLEVVGGPVTRGQQVHVDLSTDVPYIVAPVPFLGEARQRRKKEPRSGVGAVAPLLWNLWLGTQPIYLSGSGGAAAALPLLPNVHSQGYQYTSQYPDFAPDSSNVANGTNATLIAHPTTVQNRHCGFVIGVDYFYFAYFPYTGNLVVKEYSLSTGSETGSISIAVTGATCNDNYVPLTYLEDQKVIVAYSVTGDGGSSYTLKMDEIDFSGTPSSSTVYSRYVADYGHSALSLTSVNMGSYVKVLLVAEAFDWDTWDPLNVDLILTTYRSDTQATNETIYAVDTTYPSDNYVNWVYVQRSPIIDQNDHVIFFLEVDGGYYTGTQRVGEGYIINYDMSTDTYVKTNLMGQDPGDWPNHYALSYDEVDNTVLFLINQGPNNNTYPYQYFVYNPSGHGITAGHGGPAAWSDSTPIHLAGHAYAANYYAADTVGIYDYDNSFALNGTVATTWNIDGYRGMSHVGDQNGGLMWFWIGTNIVGVDVTDGSTVRTLYLGLDSANYESVTGYLSRPCSIIITSQQIFFVLHDLTAGIYLYMWQIT